MKEHAWTCAARVFGWPASMTRWSDWKICRWLWPVQATTNSSCCWRTIQSFYEEPPAFLSTSCSVVIHTAAKSRGDPKKAVQVARDEGCCGDWVGAATRKFT